MQATSDATMVLDLDGRVVRWNPASEVLYGFCEDEAIGARLPNLPEELHVRAVRDLRAVAGGGDPVSRETIALHKDGSSKYVTLKLTPLADSEGHPAAVLCLSRPGIGGASASDAFDDLLESVSAELKKPLTALAGYAQLLSRPEILEDASRRTRSIRAVEHHAAVVAELLDDAVLLSRMRSGRVRLELERVELSALVTDVVARFEQEHGSGPVVFDFAREVGAVELDRRCVERALSAMFVLVARDAPEGVSIRLEQEDTNVFIRLSRGEANGSAPSRQEADPVLEAGVGTGVLRLLAASVARAHGGSLAAGPSPGMLTMRLPVARRGER